MKILVALFCGILLVCAEAFAASADEALQDDVFEIVSHHFGSGGLMELCFKRNVGVVREHYLHNGTYDEYTKTLRSFTKAE